jgi:hypothetical protein
MKAFFSGTDNDELKINAPNYNYYLSLIVNNNMEMVAKVAMFGKADQSITIKNNEGTDFVLALETAEVVNSVDVDIYPFSEEVTIIEKRLEEIQEKKKRVVYTPPTTSYVAPGYREEYSSPTYRGRTYQQEMFQDTEPVTITLKSPYCNLPLIHSSNYQMAKTSIPWASTELLLKRFMTGDATAPTGISTLKEVLDEQDRKYALLEQVEQDIFIDMITENYKTIFASVYSDTASKEFMEAATYLASMWLNINIETSDLANDLLLCIDMIEDNLKLNIGKR